MTEIAINNLTVGYRKKTVFSRISATIPNRAICGILGPNGSGKTTLLKTINGMLTPQEGQIFIGNKNISDMNRRTIAQHMSMVPQKSSVVFPYHVEDIVLMGKTHQFGFMKSPTDSDYEEVNSVLNLLGLSYLSNRIFTELSGGEQQMILLARAVLQNCGIMLLDEPTSHLDYRNQVVIMENIMKIVLEKSSTAVITLHDPNLAFQYCTHILMMREGKILAYGKNSDLKNENLLKNLYQLPLNIEILKTGGSVILPSAWSENNA